MTEKELSIDELFEQAKLQEEAEQRKKLVEANLVSLKAQKKAIDARTKSSRISTTQFYKEMQEMRASGVTLTPGARHDIELIEL